MSLELTVRISKSDMLKHFFICGASGSGKSVLMQSMFYDQIRTSAKREHSQILIEPHGDFSGKIAFARIIDKERLVFISSGNTINRDAHTEGITGIFNPFLNDGSEEMRYCLTHELTNAIAELLESSQHATQFGITVQMATLLSPAIAVTLASPEPSIHTLKRLFMEDENEDLLQIAKHLHPQIRDFFAKQWASEKFKVSKASILTKLTYFLNDIHLYNMMMYVPPKGPSLEQHINSGSIIIFHCPKGAGGFISHFVGRLAVAYVLAVIMRREAVPAHKRLPVFMYIDEAQVYASSSLTTSLQEARKYKLGVVLATQNIKSFELKIRQAIMTNTYTKAISMSDADSRATFAREMDIDTEKLQLEPLHFVLKRMDTSSPFRFKVKFLSDHLFLNGKEKQDLYKYLIERSGFYTKVPDPPPPSPPRNEIGSKGNNERKTKKQKDDNPFDGNMPAFN